MGKWVKDQALGELSTLKEPRKGIRLQARGKRSFFLFRDQRTKTIWKLNSGEGNRQGIEKHGKPNSLGKSTEKAERD